MVIQKLIYSLSIRAYYLAIKIASLFNAKASQWINGRKFPIQKIEEESIWFHCASLGEFEQARPLLEKIKSVYPQYEIILTFFSPSGYEIRKNYECADYIYYLPLDTKEKAINFIEKVNPKMVFFIKYEFWYHFLNELDKKNIPTFLISGIFRENQSFFKFYGSLFRNMLSKFDHLFVQDENSLNLLKSIKIENTSQVNDTRFDRVIDIKNKAKDFPEIERFVGDNKCIIIGSSWLEDEKMFASISESLSNHKLIIAPHHIIEKRITKVQNLFTDSVLYSNIESFKDETCLIIDNIGMLSSIYRYGQIAYIGGGFGVSIHNILEAAVYGIPVIFGPAHKKMKEASDLIQNGGGFEVNNQSELNTIIDKLQDEDFINNSSQKSGDYVSSNSGGTEKVLSFLKKEKLL